MSDCSPDFPVTAHAIRRFFANVEQTDDGCWQWTGSTRADGYGRMRIEAKERTAHRYAFFLFVGPIPDGFHVDHLCRNPACVNPIHLEAVTHAENLRRGVTPALRASGAAAQFCPNGHLYDESTLLYRTTRKGTKVRMCRTCRVEATRRYRERKAGAA